MDKYEQKFRNWCRANNWKFLKQRAAAGTPDFIIYRNNYVDIAELSFELGHITFMEVKGTEKHYDFQLSRLSKSQKKFFENFYNVAKVFYINKPKQSKGYTYNIISLAYDYKEKQLVEVHKELVYAKT